ncbi:membrane-spanning 4-domains subfamily A member 18-like [Ptychodera flava]|uniref:membrane-spanning 4-domains subfamily A member 18-like n=1 Tax=Ptychodera flava TaxID=63121 RepID=UPI00396A9858
MEQSKPAGPTYNEGQYQQSPIILQTSNQQNQGQGFGFPHKTVAGIGITQIILGVVSIVAGIVVIFGYCTLHESGVGIWCGVFILVTGALGCLSASKQSIGPIVASMVLSIINATVFCPTLLILSSIAVGVAYDDSDACIAAGSIMIIVAVLSAILSIINSVYSCMGCCCKNRETQQIIYVTTGEGAMGATNMMYSVQGAQPSGTVFMIPATAQNMYTNNFPTSQQVLTEGSPPAYQMQSGYATAQTIPGTVPAVQSFPAEPEGDNH